MLYIASSNADKKREVELIMGCQLTPIEIEIDEIQSLDVTEVARKKAEYLRDRGFRRVIVDDTSFSIDALNGLPGPFITWFLKTLGVKELAQIATSRGGSHDAKISTCVAYLDEGGSVTTFLSEVRGVVCAEPKGTNGFGFDTIFIPGSLTKTLAELSVVGKQEFNPRNGAVRQLCDYLVL